MASIMKAQAMVKKGIMENWNDGMMILSFL